MQKLMTLDLTTQTAAVAAAASTAASWALGDWAFAIFGVPLATVLAAFAGAIVSNTWMRPKGLYSVAYFLIGATLFGSYVAPLLAKIPQIVIVGVPSLPEALEKPIAFLLGLTFQVSVPALFERIRPTRKDNGPA